MGVCDELAGPEREERDPFRARTDFGPGRRGDGGSSRTVRRLEPPAGPVITRGEAQQPPIWEEPRIEGRRVRSSESHRVLFTRFEVHEAGTTEAPQKCRASVRGDSCEVDVRFEVRGWAIHIDQFGRVLGGAGAQYRRKGKIKVFPCMPKPPPENARAHPRVTGHQTPAAT